MAWRPLGAGLAVALAAGVAHADTPSDAPASVPLATATAAPSASAASASNVSASTASASASPTAPPASASASPSAPAASAPEPAGDKPPAKADRVPRVIGLSVGWGWNTLDKLPVSLDGSKPQPHGVNVFSDFLWQVSGLAGGWPVWLGFMAGFAYFPGQEDVRRETIALEYGILVRHTVFPFSVVRPIVAYGLGATQAWVPGVEDRAIGHLTRLSLGADVVLNAEFSLSFEAVYKIINMPAFGPPASHAGPWDFHTLGALFGAHYGF